MFAVFFSFDLDIFLFIYRYIKLLFKIKYNNYK